MEDVFDCVPLCVTEAMSNVLCAPYTREELDTALHQMHPHKAPGLDGMNPLFCQKFWNVISNDVSTAVLAILDGHAIPP